VWSSKGTQQGKSAVTHEKRTGADLVLDGSSGCAVFYCFRRVRDAVVEFDFELVVEFDFELTG
jgi:hypothetical protein